MAVSFGAGSAIASDAARQALSSYPRVFWIAGGKPKEGGIDDLTDLFPRIAKAYLIGGAASVRRDSPAAAPIR